MKILVPTLLVGGMLYFYLFVTPSTTQRHLEQVGLYDAKITP